MAWMPASLRTFNPRTVDCSIILPREEAKLGRVAADLNLLSLGGDAELAKGLSKAIVSGPAWADQGLRSLPLLAWALSLRQLAAHHLTQHGSLFTFSGIDFDAQHHRKPFSEVIDLATTAIDLLSYLGQFSFDWAGKMRDETYRFISLPIG